eukprot:COSAG02_NODE_688_length_18473_cov_77.428105_5_plen_185_part_00
MLRPNQSNFRTASQFGLGFSWSTPHGFAFSSGNCLCQNTRSTRGFSAREVAPFRARTTLAEEKEEKGEEEEEGAAMSAEGDGLAEMVRMLQEMGGWPEDNCRAALQLVGGNLEGAAEMLLGGFAIPAGMVPAGDAPTRALHRERAPHAQEREGERALPAVSSCLLARAQGKTWSQLAFVVWHRR